MAARAAFDRVTSQQADVHMDAAVGQAVSEAVVTQAFKSAVQDMRKSCLFFLIDEMILWREDMTC